MKTLGRLVVAVAIATQCFAPSTASADGQPVAGFGANGVLIDGSFSGGRQVRPQQIVQLPDGALMVSGFLQTSGQTIVQQFVARYTSQGQLDAAFGTGGVIFPSGVVRNFTPLPDGRLAVTAFSLPGGVGVIDAHGTMSPISDQLSPGQLTRRPDGAIIALDATARSTRVAALIMPNGVVDGGFSADVATVLPPGSRMGTSSAAYSPPNGTLLSDGRMAVAFAYSNPAPSQVFCGLVALLDDGTFDRSFGTNGLVSLPQSICRLTHFVDDTIRVSGDVGQSVVAVSPDGTLLGAVPAPLDDPDLAFEGTGRFYRQSGTSEIQAMRSTGAVDPTFGANGVASLAGMTISGFALLDSGSIVTWGNPNGNPAALAVGLIDASFGTAPQPPAIATSKFVPVSPARILDTRVGMGAPEGVVAAGGQINLQIAGRAGVPVGGVSAVVLTVTATESVQPGFVAVFPASTRRPTVSSLNLESAGQTAANLVTVKVGPSGSVTLFTSGGAQLIADITGYYTPAASSSDGRLQAASPERILDTRLGLGSARAKLPAGGQIDVQITGRGPVPAIGVSAVVLNVTGDQATADGFVTAWPTGVDRPLVSNLNLVADETRANLVVVPIGRDGQVSFFTSGGAELIADVAGWFTDTSAADDTAGLFVPITPTRMLDTRHEPTDPTAASRSLTRRIGSTSVVPPHGSAAVAANVTVTESGGPGFVTAWPASTTRPLVSNLNTVRAGQTVPNAAIVPLGADDLALFTQSGAQLIVDINGWYTNH
ncbi:MAG TPA: hypothetical protein VHQ23_10545 [Ilumatobacteraceae bacterium]|nr:hypothetical protein [Ilumatobacteraceae bacterium]